MAQLQAAARARWAGPDAAAALARQQVVCPDSNEETRSRGTVAVSGAGTDTESDASSTEGSDAGRSALTLRTSVSTSALSDAGGGGPPGSLSYGSAGGTGTALAGAPPAGATRATTIAAAAGATAAAVAAADGDDVVGVIFYLLQEGRGIGLGAKVAAYALQEEEEEGVEEDESEEEERCCSANATAADGVPGGCTACTAASPAAAAVDGPDEERVKSRRVTRRGGLDTVDANRALGLPDDVREYTAVRDILVDLRLLSQPAGTARAAADDDGASAAALLPMRPLHLLTNNPRKLEQLRTLGVPVAARLPCFVPPASPLAARYLQAKATRMGHDIPAHVFEYAANAAAAAIAAAAHD
jgi:GTP cyclohydrolase II